MFSKTPKQKKPTQKQTPPAKKTVIVPTESEVKLPRVAVRIGPANEKRTINVLPAALNVHLRAVSEE